MEVRGFSELLEKYIRECGYTNYEFARSVGINRVNIQRYLSGSRIPNRQMFEKIINELHLGSREQEEFFESYQCAFEGKDAYYMKKTIRDILENASDICGTEKQLVLVEHISQEKESEVIIGKAALEKYVWSLLYHAALQCEKQKVFCYLPADKQTIGRIFPTLIKDGIPLLENIQIIHLVQLEKRADIFAHQYHNLRVFRNVIPSFFQAGNSYEVRYYYHENPQLEMNDGLLYPYYIVLRDRVILIDSELDHALSITNEEIVKQFHEKINERFAGNGIGRLIRYYDQEVNILNHELAEDQASDTRIFLEHEPCVTYWIDEELLNAIVKPSAPHREEIVEGVRKRSEQLRETKHMILYYTEEGLRAFVETGKFGNHPEEIVRPFTVQERLLIIERMISSLADWDGEIGIINKRYLKLTSKLTLFYSESFGMLLFLQNQQKQFRYIQVKESSICRAFVNYIKGMHDQGEVFSRDETKEILIKYREWLRNK
ncbi:MAG: helix-turn-helix transcriptional regulator [Lachnospiraceae bacterium]|nr:helix-turn-helix transcriptional regulator [Lachnospiraceae bacterium]